MGLTILPPILDNEDLIPAQRFERASSEDEEGGMSIDSDSDYDSMNQRPAKRQRTAKGKISISRRSIVVPGEPITDETQWMR